MRSGVFNAHLFPIGFQLFCNHHGRGGHAALAHFCARIANHHGVVGLNLNPHIELRCVCGLSASRHKETQGHARTGGARYFQELTAVHAVFVSVLLNVCLRVHARAPFLATE